MFTIEEIVRYINSLENSGYVVTRYSNEDEFYTTNYRGKDLSVDELPPSVLGSRIYVSFNRQDGVRCSFVAEKTNAGWSANEVRKLYHL